jgi:quercetin dioxygenase-like cupin family protein
MPSLTRPLAGEHLTFHLQRVVGELRAEEGYLRSGRAGRTLVKAGPLVLTVTAIRDGVEVGTHHAETPMTLQVLEGGLHYRIGAEVAELGRGEVLFFGPGHAKDIKALGDTALLLTITRDETQDETEAEEG